MRAHNSPYEVAAALIQVCGLPVVSRSETTYLSIDQVPEREGGFGGIGV
jgi:hypothetical protein